MIAKHTAVLVVLCALLVNSAQAGFLDIGIFTTDMPFNNTDTTVVFDINNPGSGSFDFWTVVNTDLPIAALEYNVTFPTVGWTLNLREYKDSWIADEDSGMNGVLNNSIPLPGNIGGGLEITEDLYSSTGALDFHFASVIKNDVNDGVITQMADVSIERFNVDMPLNLALGNYTINLDNIAAFDSFGNSILEFEGNSTGLLNNPKNLNFSVIPEPGTFSLFLMTIFGLNSIRSRRKNRLGPLSSH